MRNSSHKLIIITTNLGMQADQYLGKQVNVILVSIRLLNWASIKIFGFVLLGRLCGSSTDHIHIDHEVDGIGARNHIKLIWHKEKRKKKFITIIFTDYNFFFFFGETLQTIIKVGELLQFFFLKPLNKYTTFTVYTQSFNLSFYMILGRS